MKTKLSILILSILLINLVSGMVICVDLDAPSPPTLSDVIIGQDITLIWTESTDEPSCSGIDYYEIFRDGESLIQTSDLTYTDVGVPYGTYTYIVHAVDKAGHETPSNNLIIPLTESIVVTPATTSGGGGGGGGGGTSPPIDEGRPLTQGSGFTPTSFEPDEEIETSEDAPNVFSRITGAVIGTLGTGGTIGVSVLILGILGSVIIITNFRKRK